MSYELLLLLFSVAAVAGFVDSIAGGGGLITIPALLSVGFPPVQALATNKLQACGGSFSASYYFVSRGAVKLKDVRLAIAMTFIGSTVGTVLVQLIDAGVLEQLIPFLLIGIVLYFLFSPRVGDSDSRQKISLAVFSCTAAMAIGFYDGFFGPGTGVIFRHCLCGIDGFFADKSNSPYQGVEFHE